MASSIPFCSHPYSQPTQLQLVGALREKDELGESTSVLPVFARQEILIGRDSSRCQHIVGDAVVSNQHLRIYTVIFDEDQAEDVAPLIYAEDLSRNGTFWNGTLIGKGNGGYLLSDGDTLRISPRLHYQFRQCGLQKEGSPFDLAQETEMKHFEKEYTISDRKLGSGACGDVFMAIGHPNRIQLACKIVDLRKVKSASHANFGQLENPAAVGIIRDRTQAAKIRSWAEKKQKECWLERELQVCHREANILALLSHPNIIGIEKIYITDNSIYIFQDLVTGGDLFSFLEHKNGKLSDVEAAVIVRQILMALDYLHSQNIVHRDLKPENILMTSLANGCRVLLTDFGHAKKIDNDRMRMTTLAGTEQYTAPEIAASSRYFNAKRGYTKAVDMWSLGCVTVVLLTGGSPFVNPHTKHYCPKLAQDCDLHQLGKITEWHFVGNRTKDFVRRLLVDEEGRMTVQDALKHPWFSNNLHRVDFEEVYHRATKHWRPRMSKEPNIEITGAHRIRKLSSVQRGEITERRSCCRKRLKPVDPPYKPYPTKMNNLLFPKRRSTLSNTMIAEVKTAINEYWSAEKLRPPVDTEHEDLPDPIADTDGDDVHSSQNKTCSGGRAKKEISRSMEQSTVAPLEPFIQSRTCCSGKEKYKADKRREASTARGIAQEAKRLARANTRLNSPAIDVDTLDAVGRGAMRPSGTLTAKLESTKGALNVVGKPFRTVAGAADKGSKDDQRSQRLPKVRANGSWAQLDRDPKERDHDKRSCQSHCSKVDPPPTKLSNAKVVVDDSICVVPEDEGGREKVVTMKLCSPLTRLTNCLQPPANTKKRRRWIYDLEEDEDEDVNESYGFSRSTLTLERGGGKRKLATCPNGSEL